MTQRKIERGKWFVHGMIGDERETFETFSKDIAKAIHKLWLANPYVTNIGMNLEKDNG